MQYYFHIRDGVTLLDDEGTTVPTSHRCALKHSQLRVPC
jgi:hypothetical protein